MKAPHFPAVKRVKYKLSVDQSVTDLEIQVNYIFRVYVCEGFTNLSHKTRNLPFIYCFGFCADFVEELAPITAEQISLNIDTR